MQTDRFPAVRPPRRIDGQKWQKKARTVGTHALAFFVGALIAVSPPPTPVAPLAAAGAPPPTTVTAPPTTETVTVAPAAREAAPLPVAAKPAVPRTSIAKATTTTKPAAPRTSIEKAATHYANCAAAKRAGAAPLHSGEGGYRAGLDRDGDGVACET